MRMFALLAASVAPLAFMSETCETVVVKMGGEDVRMNKSDYHAMDEKDRPALATKAAQREEAERPVETGATPMQMTDTAPIPPAPSAPSFIDAVPPPNPSADTLSVAKEGTQRKPVFFVVRPDGSHVEDMKDIDKDGYTDQQAAWNAIMLAKREPALQSTTEPLPHMPNMPEAGEPNT